MCGPDCPQGSPEAWGAGGEPAAEVAGRWEQEPLRGWGCARRGRGAGRSPVGRKPGLQSLKPRGCGFPPGAVQMKKRCRTETEACGLLWTVDSGWSHVSPRPQTMPGAHSQEASEPAGAGGSRACQGEGSRMDGRGHGGAAGLHWPLQTRVSHRGEGSPGQRA